MRIPPDTPSSVRRIRTQRTPRTALVVVIGILFVLVVSLRGIASIITDYLWFDELGRTDVWSTVISARFLPAVLAGMAAFIIMLVSLIVAERLAPTFRQEGPEDEITARYRDFVAPFAGRLRVAISALFAIAVGIGASAEWKSWLLFQNSVDFGQSDPQFHKDISFYVFRLPFINFALGLSFGVLIFVFLVTLASHYLNGGIRFQAPFQRVTPQVKAHLSVLVALMAFVKTGQYWFGRYDLVFSTRGTRQGALYTDVKVHLPAYNLLVFIAVIAAILFVANIWRRGWLLPIAAAVLWAFVSVVVGSVVPALTQKYSVENSERTKESPYIERNIAATRDGFGIGDISKKDLTINGLVDRDDVNASGGTIDQVRIWEPSTLRGQLNEQQGLRSYYNFTDLDVDRYKFGTDYKTVLIGARDLNTSKLPNDSWITRHLIYTHGSGVAIAAGDASEDQNASYRLSGIPPVGDDEVQIDPKYTGIYFGEGLDGFVVANSSENEVEAGTSTGESEVEVNYEGSGGVEVGGFFNKSALALRFWDRNLFLSSSVTSDSLVMWNRDPRARVENIAPFLTVDGDPYPVVLNGRVVWVVDGYTTTNRFPYSQSTSLAGSHGLAHEFNYVRNSVKGVVDAYDGTVKLYAWDEKDPILKAWRRVFPDLVLDRSEIDPGLEAHFRYPEELFEIQTRRYAEYHVADAGTFYDGDESWQIASSATNPVSDGATLGTIGDPVVADGNGVSQRRGVVPVDPVVSLYQVLTLPGSAEDESEFVLARSFVPIGKENVLRSIVFARSDPGHYGELVVYEVDTAALSPVAAGQVIQRDTEIAKEISLLKQKGSDLEFGEMRLLPVGDSLLFVQPFYIKGDARSSYLVLQGVAVTDGESAVLAPTFDEALDKLLGVMVEPDPDPDPDPGNDQTVGELVGLALDEFSAADAAAATGEYEAQGRHLAKAREYLERIAELEVATVREPVADPEGT